MTNYNWSEGDIIKTWLFTELFFNILVFDSNNSAISTIEQITVIADRENSHATLSASKPTLGTFKSNNIRTHQYPNSNDLV